jgi:hypothetical protein
MPSGKGSKKSNKGRTSDAKKDVDSAACSSSDLERASAGERQEKGEGERGEGTGGEGKGNSADSTDDGAARVDKPEHSTEVAAVSPEQSSSASAGNVPMPAVVRTSAEPRNSVGGYADDGHEGECARAPPSPIQASPFSAQLPASSHAKPPVGSDNDSESAENTSAAPGGEAGAERARQVTTVQAEGVEEMKEVDLVGPNPIGTIFRSPLSSDFT